MIAILARVMIRIGTLSKITHEVIGQLSIVDFSYLQQMYQMINHVDSPPLTITCPYCGHTYVEDFEFLNKS